MEIRTDSSINSALLDNARFIPCMRQWDCFNEEKLQNIDENGNQVTEEEKKELERVSKKVVDLCTIPQNYMDILIEDSKTQPQILVYSGKNLSENQRDQIENFHEMAKTQGGEVFLLDGDKIFEEELKESEVFQVYAQILENAKSTIDNILNEIYKNEVEINLLEENIQECEAKIQSIEKEIPYPNQEIENLNRKIKEHNKKIREKDGKINSFEEEIQYEKNDRFKLDIKADYIDHRRFTYANPQKLQDAVNKKYEKNFNLPGVL